MQPGYICVAGLDITAGQHVRPVLIGRLSRDLLASQRGVFDNCARVDLGPVSPVGHPPETEDHRFDQTQLRLLAYEKESAFWGRLETIAQTSLTTIFGPELQQRGSGCTVDLHKGVASLGCLIPSFPPELEVNPWDRIRIEVKDERFTLDLSVTDLRLYEADHVTPKYEVIENVAKRMRAKTPVILSAGLARAWRKPGDNAERHWLQVNNIHLGDDPGWRYA